VQFSSGAATLTLHITRDEFDAISKGIFKGVSSLVETVLNKAKVLGVKIDEVCIRCGSVWFGIRTNEFSGPSWRRYCPSARSCSCNYTPVSSAPCGCSGTTSCCCCQRWLTVYFHSISSSGIGPLPTHCRCALLNFNPNNTCRQRHLGNTTFIVAAAGTRLPLHRRFIVITAFFLQWKAKVRFICCPSSYDIGLFQGTIVSRGQRSPRHVNS
jgi:hypothetical protein